MSSWNDLVSVVACLLFAGGYGLGVLAFAAFGHGAAGILAVIGGVMLQCAATGWLVKDAVRRGRDRPT